MARKDFFSQIDKSCCLGVFGFLSTYQCLELLGSLVQLVGSFQPAHRLFLVGAESQNFSLSAAAAMHEFS